MANASTHSLQAIHNDDLVNVILGLGNYFDWGVTVCFYAAIHYIDEELANRGLGHPRNHSDRWDIVFQNIDIPPDRVSTRLATLENLSRTARYLTGPALIRTPAYRYFSYVNVTESLTLVNEIRALL